MYCFPSSLHWLNYLNHGLYLSGDDHWHLPDLPAGLVGATLANDQTHPGSESGSIMGQPNNQGDMGSGSLVEGGKSSASVGRRKPSTLSPAPAPEKGDEVM